MNRWRQVWLGRVLDGDASSRHGMHWPTVCIAGAALLTGCATATATAPPRGLASTPSCFAIDALPAAQRQLADRLLLDTGDREGLYTLAGGLKPMSSDVFSMQIQVRPTPDTAQLATLDRLRDVTSQLHCGDIGLLVQVFNAPVTRDDGTVVRNATVTVFHRGALQHTVRRHAAFFATLGVTPSTDPASLLSAVEHAPRADRWRGYGYLFGYPDHAVDFFVEAGVRGDSTRQLVPRDFVRIETFRKSPAERGAVPTLSSFVYAVPRGAPATPADSALRQAAAPLFERYRALRAQFIRQDSSGARALWQRWLNP